MLVVAKIDESNLLLLETGIRNRRRREVVVVMAANQQQSREVHWYSMMASEDEWLTERGGR